MGHNTLMLGLDAGGTSTRAVLMTGQGDCVGYGVGGRGNPIAAGPELAAQGVLDAVTLALAPSSRNLADVSVITAAMAGQKAAEGEGAWLRDRLAAEGFAGMLTFESDLLATYFSGSVEPFGYAIVAGTGACAVCVSGGRIAGTADGLGWLLGDRGSGFWIGRRVARAVARDLDDTGPATTLTGAVLEHLNIVENATHREGRSRTLENLVGSLYGAMPIELATLAPLAFTADDPVAERILRRAGEHLADSFAALLSDPGPVVVGGSVLFRPSAVRNAFMQRLGDAAAGLEFLPVVDGAVGAGVLALRAGGVTMTAETHAIFRESLARFR